GLLPYKKIPPFLAADFAPQAGAALLSGRDKTLRLHRYPEFGLQSIYDLDGLAYRLALDERGGLLYAAMYPPDVEEKDLERYKIPSRLTELHVYDVKALLKGEVPNEKKLKPAATLLPKNLIRDIAVSPDGAWLYCLDKLEQKVLRFDTGKRQRSGE